MIYSLDNARSLLAIAAILLFCWLLSENKRRFPFLMALGALAVQAGLVLVGDRAAGVCACVGMWPCQGSAAHLHRG